MSSRKSNLPRILDPINNAFQASDDLPIQAINNLDGLIRFLLKRYRGRGEDLNEQQYYLSIPWQEVRDQDGFTDRILHYFNPEGEYLRSINGKVFIGEWRLPSSVDNKMLITIDTGDDEEADLYDLGFLGGYFFILSKHNLDQYPVEDTGYMPRYLVLGQERRVANLSWVEYIQLFNETFRERSSMYTVLAIIIIFVIGFLVVFSMG